MHFDIGVIAVRLAGEQRLNLRFTRIGFQLLEEVDAFLLGCGVAGLLVLVQI